MSPFCLLNGLPQKCFIEGNNVIQQNTARAKVERRTQKPATSKKNTSSMCCRRQWMILEASQRCAESFPSSSSGLIPKVFLSLCDAIVLEFLNRMTVPFWNSWLNLYS